MQKWMSIHETHCYSPMEPEFNDWYNKIHLPDVLDTPGFLAATRYKIMDYCKGRGTYLVRYEIESDDIEETMSIRAKRAAKEIAQGRGSDFVVDVWPSILYRKLVEQKNPTRKTNFDEERWIVLVETNPKPGKKDEYNEWYDDHLFDALKTPDYVAASRYELAEDLPGRGKYLAIYEMDTDDIERTRRIRKEMKTEEVKQGKDPGLWVLVWGAILFKQIYQSPSE